MRANGVLPAFNLARPPDLHLWPLLLPGGRSDRVLVLACLVRARCSRLDRLHDDPHRGRPPAGHRQSARSLGGRTELAANTHALTAASLGPAAHLGPAPSASPSSATPTLHVLLRHRPRSISRLAKAHVGRHFLWGISPLGGTRHLPDRQTWSGRTEKRSRPTRCLARPVPRRKPQPGHRRSAKADRPLAT
jgi:hypothetical protein